VLDRKRLEADHADAERTPRLDRTRLGERKARDQRQRLRGGEDRARRAMRKPRSVVAVSVGEHDRRRIDPLQARKPIRPAIDHHSRTPLPHQQGAVTEMAARPDLDLAAGSEKGELDAALLPCANVVRSNSLPKKRA